MASPSVALTDGAPATAAAAVTAGRRSTRWRGAGLALATLGLYLALTLAALRPGLFSGPDTIVGNTGDPSIFIWSLAWTPFALAHHLNPLITGYVHYPSGANLMWNTSIVFPALVLSPITDLLGPIVAYNVLAVAGMTLSGWCAYLAVRRHTGRWIPAAAGGLLYQFSPFMATQITGHPHLFIAVFPPLLLLFADEILVRQRRPAWLLGLLLGFTAACQLLTGSELLVISVTMAVPALITVWVIFRKRVRERLGYILRAAAVAVGSFAVLAAYPLYVQFLGPLRVHGALQGTGFVARPTSFLVPTSFELFSGPTTVLDSSVYIGIPLLAVAVVVAVRMRHHPAVLAAAVTLACAMLLALGGHLTIHGPPTGIPLPWIIPQHLPVYDAVLPVRLMVAGYLALAVILGVFLDSVLRAEVRLRAAGLAAAAVALIPLIPSLPIPSGTYVIPAFFSDGQAARLAAQGSVLVTPYGGQELEDYLPTVWQAVSGMAFTTPDGMVFTPGPGGHEFGPEMDPLGTELHDLGDLNSPAPASLPSAVRQTYLDDLRAQGVGVVVVGPSPGEAQVVTLMTELLGRPGTATGGVVLWSEVGSTGP